MINTSALWKRIALAVAALGAFVAQPADARIDGITGTAFDLVAGADYINTGDGGSIYMWGYNVVPSAWGMQYPGPTLIVNQGATVTINLTNNLPQPVSMVFPGQAAVTATGGVAGALTQEAAPGGGTVSYSFVATRPGLFTYHSGTNQDLQIEMGLVGALIVRPTGHVDTAGNSNRRSHGHPGTVYNYETLFLLTDVDAELHTQVEAQVTAGLPVSIDMSNRFATYWFINGRNGPDTLSDAFVPWLPTQPYNATPRLHPGERLLMRVVNAGLDMHPFHHHGNHALVLAQDGYLRESAPGLGPNLATSNFTITTVPGQTYDAIWDWTGAGLGWDIYGHAPADPCAPNENCGATGDHGKPLPVTMPELVKVSPGGFFSGSPFLGQFVQLPYDQGGMNLNAGLFFMWHSHNEKELTNYNIFPGGMMTMVIVEPPGIIPPIE